MINPLRRSSNELMSADLSSGQPWDLGRWNDGERVNMARWRTGLRVPERARPVKIMVKIGYTSDRPDGLPSASTLDQLEKIEGTLIGELAENDAALVLILTGYSAREFIAYGSSHAFLQSWGPTVLERWESTHPGSGVEAELDPKWRTFRSYSK